jgi:predicted GNAT family acetyltransferase
LPGYEGRGLAGTLVDGALVDTRARGGHVRATCPYVAKYISRHAEHQDLLVDR